MSHPSATCIPFSCGTQFLDWGNRNCCRCDKSAVYDEKRRIAGEFVCEIEQALSMGALGEPVPTSLARRCGWDPQRAEYTWDCPERVELRSYNPPLEKNIPRTPPPAPPAPPAKPALVIIEVRGPQI